MIFKARKVTQTPFFGFMERVIGTPTLSPRLRCLRLIKNRTLTAGGGKIFLRYTVNLLYFS
jgi:hypothetical protein